MKRLVLLLFACSMLITTESAKANVFSGLGSQTAPTRSRVRPSRLRQKVHQRVLVPAGKVWKKSRLKGFLQGIAIDGPRGTFRAIKKRPKLFFLGLGGAVALATAGDLLGLSLPLLIGSHTFTITSHEALVGLSAGLAAFESIPQLKGVRQAKAGLERARKLGRMLWSPFLVVASAAGGSAIGSHADNAPAVSGGMALARGMLTRASGHLVTTADAPTILVTAQDGHK